MRVKAINDLVQLSDSEFFSAIAEGLRLVMRNVARLRDGATVLGRSEHRHASRVLSAIAEEEASKFLILLDAVRCPRDYRLPEQLDRFSSHLAKGIYAKVCGMRP